jgi:hypothetical protein
VLAVPELPPPDHLPPRWVPTQHLLPVVIIKVFVFLAVLGFAVAVLNAGADLVAAGTFVSLVVVSAARAGVGLSGKGP